MLAGSKFNTSENIEAFSQRFDEGLKKVFSNNQGAQYVKFGSPRDNDPSYGIRAGRLTLAGYVSAPSPYKPTLNLSRVQHTSFWVL